MQNSMKAIFVLHMMSLSKEVHQLIGDSFISSSQKNKENSVQAGCSGVNTNLRKPSLDGSSKMAASPKPQRKEVRIEVKCGSIENIEADGLVCTMGSDLDLNKAGASRALVRTAGRELQEELTHKYYYPCQLKYGEIAIVHGHKLKCKYVLLGIIDNYEAKFDRFGEGPDNYYAVTVHDFMVQCLKKADELGLSSLAFPAVGCGNMMFPVNIVADEMFRAVMMHGYNNPRTRIKLVTFVIFYQDQEAIVVFKEKERSFSARLEPGQWMWGLDEDIL